MRKICAIVLAGGKGTRMSSLSNPSLPKVLRPILGKPMIFYTAELLEKLNIPSYFVIGFGGEKVKKALASFKGIQFVKQARQLGTAHAAKLALATIPVRKYQAVLVLHGDSSAFFQPTTIRGLIRAHFKEGATLSMLTLKKKNSDGSGVLLRDKAGRIVGNAETKTKTYYNCEVNTGAFVYDLEWLRRVVPKIKLHQVSQEYYLTDTINIAAKAKNKKIITLPLKHRWEKTHINTPSQLRRAQEIARKYLNNQLDIKIAVVGLGYVGLPLAVEFARAGLAVVGFDIDKKKINKLRKNFDPSREIKQAVLKSVDIKYTSLAKDISGANFIIVTVPTPITAAKQPDLSLVKNAARLVGKNLSKKSIVVFESTVYPGVTEEICLPILEQESGLKCGSDFKIGYSPERINPGDQEHTLEKIIKIVSGCDKKALDLIAQVYGLICRAGVYRAESIKVAEAAKVIENIQRDLNIALMNELSLIFEKIGIDTHQVLEAAATKWNFHRYSPGLVGGHCIGVDPYYLTYRAQELGYHPEVILAGRRINDFMPSHVADLMIRELIKAGKRVEGAKVLILGLTFKENVADIRNSKIKDTITRLKEYQIKVYGMDPNLSINEVKTFGVEALSGFLFREKFDGIILAAPHQQFKKINKIVLSRLVHKKLVLISIKPFFNSRQLPKQIIYKLL